MSEAIKDFVAGQAPDTDVFCLQEVYRSSQPMFEGLLPGFNSIYAHKALGDFADFWQATYVKDGLRLHSQQTILADTPGTGLGLSAELEGDKGSVHVCNVHGIAYRKDDKLDNAERLQQSREMIDYFCTLRGPKIIGGDFNVLPDTESVRMFEKNGYVDLIKAYNISTTRNRLAWEEHPGSKQYYSDYVFVSPDVAVRNFAVLQNEVSDHLPLVLDVDR